MGKSFLRPELPAEIFADRQWLLGVYRHAGRAARAKAAIISSRRARLGRAIAKICSLFLESADAP